VAVPRIDVVIDLAAVSASRVAIPNIAAPVDIASTIPLPIEATHLPTTLLSRLSRTTTLPSVAA
jgi:hypothetical protein